MYEFDNNSTYTPGNIVIPLGSTFADTFDNLLTELTQNPNLIVTKSGSNAFLFQAKNFGSTGNTLALSGSSVAFTLFPSSGTLL